MRRGLFEVAALQNTIEVAVPAEKLFDFVVDVRNEPRWNPQMLDAQMLSPEPVGVGTTFRVTFGRGVGEALIQYAQMERPHSYTAVSRSQVLDVQSEGLIEEVPTGGKLTIRTRLQPHGMLRLLTPALGLWMRRTWDQDLHRVKALLEHDIPTANQAESADAA